MDRGTASGRDDVTGLLRRLPGGLGVQTMALITFALAAALGWRELAHAWHNHALLFVFAGWFITLGELGEITMPTGRRLAPVSLATGLTLATVGPLRDAATVDIRPAVVILIFGSAQVLAVVIGRRHREQVSSAAARLVGIAVTAILARRQPVGGHTWWDWQLLPSTPRVDVALGLVVICTVGVVVERVLAGLARARQTHAMIRSALKDEYREAIPLTLALVAPAPMATLLAPVLGLAAIPLALAPVVVTYAAVRRFAAVGATFRQSVRTLSRLTEEGGFTPRRHAERVADLARSTARRLGLAQRDVDDLEFAALLHDLGQLALHEPIPDGATVLAAPADQQAMASAGAAIIRHSPDLTRAADLVDRQSVPYRSVVEYAEEVPLASRILKVANAFDDFTAGRRTPVAIRAATERIHLGLGYEYDPVVVAALEQVVEQRWSAERT